MLFRFLGLCCTSLMTSALVPAPAREALVERMVVAVVRGSLWTQLPTSQRLMVFSDLAAAVVAAGWSPTEDRFSVHGSSCGASCSTAAVCQ